MSWLRFGGPRWLQNQVKIDKDWVPESILFQHRLLHRCLVPFLPGCTKQEWKKLETEFTSKESVWNDEHDISVDMLKQFLMHEITEAHRFRLGDFQPNNRNERGDFHINPHSRSFF